MAFQDVVTYFNVPLLEWTPISETITETGYDSIQRSLGSNQYQIVQMPFEHNTTREMYRLTFHGDVFCAYVLVVIGFFAVVQALKGLVWSWIT